MNIKNINGLNFLYKSHINKTPIRLFLSKEIKKDDDLKKKSLCNSTSGKYNLKKKLFITYQDKAEETSDNNSNSNDNIMKNNKIKYKNTINIPLINNYNNRIFQNELLFNSYSNNRKTNGDNNLAIIKNRIIYWLRKLYIIIQNKPININTLEKKLLNIYFYFPIKEANTSKYKIHLYNPKRSKISEKFFCNNLDDISKLIRSYLKFNKISDYSKINLYDENFHYIKSSQDLEKKNEKYKVLYAKVIDLSKEQFEQKINKCVLHDKTWKSFDIMDVDKHKNNNLLSNLFNNKFIKNKILLGEKNNKQKEIHSNMKYSKTSFQDITKTLKDLLVNDICNLPSFNNNINRNKKINFLQDFYIYNDKDIYTHNFQRNNTLSDRNCMKLKKHKLVTIKSNKLWNSKSNKIFII